MGAPQIRTGYCRTGNIGICSALALAGALGFFRLLLSSLVDPPTLLWGGELIL